MEVAVSLDVCEAGFEGHACEFTAQEDFGSPEGNIPP